MERLIEQFFNLEIMIAAWPMVLEGLWTTLLLCAVVVPLGLIGGLFAALGSLARPRLIRWPTVALVDFFRAIPPLVLLIFVYSGLPFAGVQFSPFAAVAFAFFLNNSAYYGEAYRAGIESVGAGQGEAARSTGLSAAQTMAYVVLPQAVRNVLPDLLSNTIEVVKLHLARLGRLARRDALSGQHGPLGHLQRLADRAGGLYLSGVALAAGAAGRPLRAAHRIVRRYPCARS